MKINQSKNDEANWFAILLLVNFLTVTFWIVSQNVDVYRFAIVGAIFELFWLPIIASLLLMPFVSIFFWYKDKFKKKSKFVYLLLVSLLSIILALFA
ncbi:MAG: hypothetical protein CMC96_08755 [Flavobacteriales bacterium]|nr:hypothetical protein [Flavobacteriales bacterium]|tara:strand:- start:471 stop:761 length:291 start_codon:yes stop_codon:yes gene_type:complete